MIKKCSNRSRTLPGFIVHLEEEITRQCKIELKSPVKQCR